MFADTLVEVGLPSDIKGVTKTIPNKLDIKWHACHPKDNQISMFYGIEKVIDLKR